MSVVSDVQASHQTPAVAQYDVVVVGAGPYGLTTAAHLQGRGLKVAVFGKPLELWRDHMPPGMKLRSHWWATSLSEPSGKYSFKRFYAQSSSYKAGYPVPIQAFIDYGMWFQKHVVPDVDETYVSTIERKDGSFFLTLTDGRIVQSPAVVMAIGVYYFANRPAEYTHLPTTLVSHSFDHGAFDKFKGKTIVVVGGGQSGVENSALLHEKGARVHLVTRRPIHWLDPDRADERTLVEQIKAPNAGIAPGWKNWILEYVPYLFYMFDQTKKDRYLRNHYNAAANDWLHDRVVGKVSMYEGQDITSLEAADDGVDVTLSKGEKIHADHVMLATGYQVKTENLSMVDPSLRAEIRSYDGTPLLNHWFESSVPGMYFVGLASVRAFGPLYRFVVGNKATAQRVAAAVARRVARVKSR